MSALVVSTSPALSPLPSFVSMPVSASLASLHSLNGLRGVHLLRSCVWLLGLNHSSIISGGCPTLGCVIICLPPFLSQSFVSRDLSPVGSFAESQSFVSHRTCPDHLSPSHLFPMICLPALLSRHLARFLSYSHHLCPIITFPSFVSQIFVSDHYWCPAVFLGPINLP